MRRYFNAMPEQTKLFLDVISPLLADADHASVLDVACGLGDLSYWLAQKWPDVQFTGVEKEGFLVEEADALCSSLPNVHFIQGDLYSLSSTMGIDSSDIVVCKQTLSWLPSYQSAVAELVAVARRGVVISSLFYDGRIDYEIRVRERGGEPGDPPSDDVFYNIYSWPLFREYCHDLGVRSVEAVDFQIGIDLPKPESPDIMGTYTLRLESGERIQVSGALLMPWKIVTITP